MDWTAASQWTGMASPIPASISIACCEPCAQSIRILKYKSFVSVQQSFAAHVDKFSTFKNCVFDVPDSANERGTLFHQMMTNLFHRADENRSTESSGKRIIGWEEAPIPFCLGFATQGAQRGERVPNDAGVGTSSPPHIKKRFGTLFAAKIKIHKER